MASPEAAIKKVHNEIVSKSLGGATSKWTIFSTLRGLKVEEDYDGNTVREGDLNDFVKDFTSSDYTGSMLFALLKLKVPNTHPAAEKVALIEWCDTNAPPAIRSNYFPNQSNQLKKLLPGIHVPYEIRSREDLTVDEVVQKVAGAASQSGAIPRGPPPPLGNKPIRPTRVGGGGTGFNPLPSRTVPTPQAAVDKDGWGADAPQLTRTQLEPVQSAYKKHVVDLGQLRNEHKPSGYQAPARNEAPSDVRNTGHQKIDPRQEIAALKAKAKAAPPPSASSGAPAPSQDEDERPKSLAERSAAFSQQPERLTSLPKPQVSNKFGGGGSKFTGTKAPLPGGFGAKPAPPAPSGAIRTFADKGGKTPQQLFEERKARQGGTVPSVVSPVGTGPIASQPSGDSGWKSSYEGKKWGTVQTTRTGQSAASNLSAQQTGQDEQEEEEPAASPAGGVSAIRDRFKDTTPIGMGAPPPRAVPEPYVPEPPAMDLSSKPNAGGPPRGVPIPGLPSRPTQEEEEESAPQSHDLPPPPARPRSPDPPTPDEMRDTSPVRIAMPVGRGAAVEREPEDDFAPPVPTASLSEAASAARNIPDEPQVEDDEPARGAAQAAAGVSGAAASTGGQVALIQYDYDPAEDNELELKEGDYVTNIDMVDEDWWMGTNSKGESGLFPSNYVELVEDGPAAAAPAAHSAPAPPAAPPAASQGKTATAQYDYDAAEDNELSFPDGAKITGVEFPDEDWWFGHYGGKEGLFPANYVQLDD